MSQDLLTQLAEYGAYCEERQGTVDATDVIGPVVPIPTPVSPSRPVRGWLVAAAASALVLLVVGGVTVLGPFSVSDPVAEQPTATTIPTEIVDTTVPDEGQPSEVTETTLASIPVPPPGEGPKLEFVQGQHPEGTEGLRGGYWFKGALYAYSEFFNPSQEIELYRSADGFNWEVVPGFDPTDRWGPKTKTDGERLVNVAAADSYGNCFGTDASGTDASIWVNTSTDGVEWTSSEIPLPLLSTSSNTGCFNSYGADFAIGPRGIIVTTSVDLSIGGGFTSGLVDPDDGIHVEVVEMDLERSVVTYQFIKEETGEVVDTVEVEVDGLGKPLDELLDAMEADPAWAPTVGPLLQNMAENGGGESGVNNGFAWFSADGETWTPIDGSGLLDGLEFSEIVATDDGFWASMLSVNQRTNTQDDSTLWESTDGVSWTESEFTLGAWNTYSGRIWPPELYEWNGVPVVLSYDPAVAGVRTIGDSPVELLSADATEDIQRYPWTNRSVITIGEFGLIGMAGQHNEEMFYSRDGTSWARWVPTEFDPEDGELWVIGMGDDFFVMRQGRCNPEPEAAFCTIWVGTLP